MSCSCECYLVFSSERENISDGVLRVADGEVCGCEEEKKEKKEKTVLT